MSKAMTPAQWKAQLKKWRVPVVYLPGWDTRGRPDSTAGGPLEPNGGMIHHTGSDDQAQSYIDWLFKTGRPAEGIPAPLANVMTMMDGRLIMGAVGKANHAGKGVASVLAQVIAETVPLDREVKPGGVGNTNGNPRFYGNEVAYDGGQPMTAAQYDTVLRWCAAICDFHGWTAASFIGHGEWTSAKWDPGQTDMAKLRRDVNALLAAGPDDSPAPKPEPTPTPAPTPDKPAAVDKLDPAAYHPGAVGPHVTWLGQRINAWRAAYGLPSLYTVGPGPDLGPKDNAGVQWFQRTVLGAEGIGADGWPGVVSLRTLATDPPPAVRAPNRTAPKTLPADMAKMYHIPAGAWYPEGDSIIGLEAALADGHKWTDMDWHLTKDNVWVCGHWSDIAKDHYTLPATFTRKYGQHPRIEDVLWADLKELRTAEKVSRGVRQTFRYSDAAEVFAWLAVHPTMNVAMELKGSPGFDQPDTFARLHAAAVDAGIDPATRLLIMSQPPWPNLIARFKAAHLYFRTAVQRLGWKKPGNWSAIAPHVDYVRSGDWGTKTR